MNEILGWYYLHTNGDLLYKREMGGTAADIRESDLAVALWPFSNDRMAIWALLVEALAAGARPDRVTGLAQKWGCDDADAKRYAERLGVSLSMDGSAWTANVTEGFTDMMECEVSFSDTSWLEALANLAKALGYKPSKTWGTTFAELVKATAKRQGALPLPGRMPA